MAAVLHQVIQGSYIGPKYSSNGDIVRRVNADGSVSGEALLVRADANAPNGGDLFYHPQDLTAVGPTGAGSQPLNGGTHMTGKVRKIS